MKRIAVILTVLLAGVQIISAQTAFEDAVKRVGILLNVPISFHSSENSELISPAAVTEGSPIPDIAQQYGLKPAHGNTFFNAYFGLVTAVLEHSDGECIVLASIPPGKGGGGFGYLAKDSLQEAAFEHLFFGRIKHDFRYGKPFSGASEVDVLELYSMLNMYPSEKAGDMFKAEAMAGYPLNFRGNVFKGNYTRGRGVAIGKDGLCIFLYFLMTDESVFNFETYLEEFDGAFVFE
ncbi:hypothetical protein [uncultured Draconibacterium sp.]|uniref:hypothetical protein n=1 Tax=uncultured Draconibacterium sp. TaxID=1573823 RepID=UPI0029C80171|nr:hypothetical protein [uncultured Draconibacterium sp.]